MFEFRRDWAVVLIFFALESLRLCSRNPVTVKSHRTAVLASSTLPLIEWQKVNLGPNEKKFFLELHLFQFSTCLSGPPCFPSAWLISPLHCKMSLSIERLLLFLQYVNQVPIPRYGNYCGLRSPKNEFGWNFFHWTTNKCWMVWCYIKICYIF